MGSAGSLEIVNDLRQSVDGIVEAVVEAVHEDKDFAFVNRLDGVGDRCREGGSFDVVRRDRDEVLLRITRRLTPATGSCRSSRAESGGIEMPIEA